MSKTNRIIRGHAGRIPNNRSKTGIQVESYLEDFVKKRGICTSGDVVKEGMIHFRLSRSQVYTVWNKVKMNNVIRATEEELKQYGISTIKGNTTYWIHINSSKIREEFRELILALSRSTTKSQFLGLLGELGEDRFQVFLKNGPVDGIDQLVGLLMLMLHKDCPVGVSKKYGLTKLEINFSEITEYAHVVANYLKKMHPSGYMSSMYRQQFLSIFNEELEKSVVENMTVSSVYELLKHISFIVSDIDNELFNEAIFLSFKQNLTADEFKFDKIYGGIHNLIQLISELTKESGKKKLQYKFWRYMWQILLTSFDKIPAEELNNVEREKIAITVNSISSLNTPNGPNGFNEIRILIDGLRKLCE
jgi:hypothetical protein